MISYSTPNKMMLAIVGLVALGAVMVFVGRQTAPDTDNGSAWGPTINDHWHAAYGFNLCGTWERFDGALEELDSTGRLTNVDYLRTGVHSHSDGVVHWHAFTSQATGSNATFGLFLDNYDVDVDEDGIAFGNADFGITGDYTTPMCDGEPAEYTVTVIDTLNGNTQVDFDGDLGDIPIDRDGLAIAVSVLPAGSEISMPPWTPQLPELGAIDGP